MKIVKFRILVHLVGLITNAVCTERQCHRDCKAPPYARPVGPTRPYDESDPMGDTLLLTRPYPYAYAEKELLSFLFNVTLSLYVSGNHDRWQYSHFDRNCASHAFREILARFSFHKVEILSEKNATFVKQNDDLSKNHIIDIIFETEVRERIENHTNDKLIETFFEIRIEKYLRKMTGNLTSYYLKCISNINSDNLFGNSTLYLTVLPSNTTSNNFVHRQILSPSYPNRFSRPCELGCTLFYSLDESPKQLSSCFSLCDAKYKYNLTVGYNDLMELVRLECRDGCRTALIRCQPGYFCIQPPKILDKNGQQHLNISMGSMHECPPGTYRDISYQAVESCVPCPAGRFREAKRGGSMESCTKCPVGTAVNSTGSSSILDCKRCPAGRYTTEPGRHVCECITPQACADDQYDDPADAEKRNTVPFIGRW